MIASNETLNSGIFNKDSHLAVPLKQLSFLGLVCFPAFSSSRCQTWVYPGRSPACYVSFRLPLFVYPGYQNKNLNKNNIVLFNNTGFAFCQFVVLPYDECKFWTEIEYSALMFQRFGESGRYNSYFWLLFILSCCDFVL